MTIDSAWKDPGPLARTGVNWSQEAALMRAEPRKWRFIDARGADSARTTASAITNGRHHALVEGFEGTTRSLRDGTGQTELYVRYVGTGEQEAG